MQKIRSIIYILLYGLGWLAFLPVQAQTSSTDALEPRIYLPFIIRPEEIICQPNPQEQQIAYLLINDPEQNHPSLTCNPILEQVAGERAQDMINRDYFSHVNPDGYGPNYLVELAGYVLPDWYSGEPEANNIESIAGGYSNASSAWAAWMASAGHRSHLLGETEFYRNQTEYGIGYAYSSNSDYGHYWVVIIAQPGP